MNNTQQTPNSEQKMNNNVTVTEAEHNAANSLYTLFLDHIKAIYWTEKQLLNALPKMATNASSPNLKSSITDHISVTENQVVRLKKVFDLLQEPVTGKICEAATGLIKEGDLILKQTAFGSVRDAAIIAACQKVEHYEIAAYGTLLNFSKILGADEATQLFQQTLAEEKESDKILTDVANVSVNREAL